MSFLDLIRLVIVNDNKSEKCKESRGGGGGAGMLPDKFSLFQVILIL